MNKKYDYLDQRNSEFENDYKSFLALTDELKEEIAETIETSYDSVWETPQGIQFLTRFEKVFWYFKFMKIYKSYLNYINVFIL